MTQSLDQRTLSLLREAITLQLWHSGAIAVSSATPYRLVSGNFSPIYVNCRQLISSTTFVDLFCGAMRLLCTHEGIAFDAVAGGETAGIPFAAFVARHFGLPMLYVRKAAKEHGLRSQVEGLTEVGSRVLLVEDLVTDAGSKLSFVEALRSAGYLVEHVVVVFDRQQGGRELLTRGGLVLHSFADMTSALAIAERASLLSAEQLAEVTSYLASPVEWHARRGLSYSQ